MTRALYLVGAPGVGKSSVIRAILQGGWDVGGVFNVTHRQTGFPCLCTAHPWGYKRWTQREMLGHLFTSPTHGMAAYMGHLRSEYPGTDALSRSVMPQVKLWLPALPMVGLSWLFGEGERLGTVGFLTELADAAELRVVHLVAAAEVLEQRRADRPGKVLPEQHCKSKAAQAANVAQALSAVEVDADRPLAQVAADIMQLWTS